MADLGFVCRGNGGQGNTAHSDGLVHDRRGTQAGKLTGERFVAGHVAEQHGFFGGIRTRLVVGLGFGMGRRILSVDAPLIFGRGIIGDGAIRVGAIAAGVTGGFGVDITCLATCFGIGIAVCILFTVARIVFARFVLRVDKRFVKRNLVKRNPV